MDPIAAADQAQMGARSMAAAAWLLMSELEQQGFTREEALGLVEIWFGSLVASSLIAQVEDD